MWSIISYMAQEQKEREYAPVYLKGETKDRLVEVAKAEGRTISGQAEIFIQLGLKEYKRLENVRSGNSQIDMERLEAMR